MLAAAKSGWTAERRFGPIIPAQHIAHAEVLLLNGDEAGSLSELEYASAHGWTGHYAPVADLQDPIFDPIRKHPRFKAVELRIAQTRERERQELAAHMGRIAISKIGPRRTQLVNRLDRGDAASFQLFIDGRHQPVQAGLVLGLGARDQHVLGVRGAQ